MKSIARGSVVAVTMVVLLGPLAQAQLEESYNMASPYVESKEPLSSLAVSPKGYGKGLIHTEKHPIYGNPMAHPLPNLLIGGSYGTSPGALNTPPNRQPQVKGGNSYATPETGLVHGPDGMLTDVHVAPIPGASGYLPGSPSFGHKGEGYVGMNPSKPMLVGTQDPAAYAPQTGASPMIPGGIGGNQNGWPAMLPRDAAADPLSAGLFGLTAKPFQEKPGSTPRPISAPGYPYAGNSVLGDKVVSGNPYFPGTASNSVPVPVDPKKDGYLVTDAKAARIASPEGLSPEEEDLIGHSHFAGRPSTSSADTKSTRFRASRTFLRKAKKVH